MQYITLKTQNSERLKSHLFLKISKPLCVCVVHVGVLTKLSQCKQGESTSREHIVHLKTL